MDDKNKNICPVCSSWKDCVRTYCMECTSYESELKKEFEQDRRQEQMRKRIKYFHEKLNPQFAKDSVGKP